MKSLEDITKSLSEERPASWDALPDIDLYMDQVLGYMRRQLYSSRPESNVTAAMINNYIRSGILPRTSGKKYSRGHIARLTTICVLKQVLSVGDISLLIKLFPPETLHQVYETYREVLDGELTSVAENVPEEDGTLILADAIVRFAVTSYANKVAAEHLIDMVKEQMCDEKEKDQKHKK
ncbi:MAG: DUF1836 domain-containing protein [Peptococcaceae bacterium]|nr:DUF1836 domain-containing protein [Peptococcaceae bacterium]